eukprot:TRINITY_DN1417_c0_g1_i1.p1 TRINITY_DN1417_c0_g1~~TRINITY_DN1417_c0_g1_i1.p1  ORF type:complete len:350 (-),score=38.05 TRINITY_DN1417_c0_g1_i1:78-1127(-)
MLLIMFVEARGIFSSQCANETVMSVRIPTLDEIEALLDADDWQEKVGAWMGKMDKCEALSEGDMMDLCDRVKDVLIEENTIVELPAPITVVGDIHGQFYDLLHMFKESGDPRSMSYVFLGDYVDRGYYSLQTLTYLFLLKVQYPDHISLVRGNHEARSVSQVYGFYDECIKQYGDGNIWRNCCEVFDLLPLGAIVDDRVLCVHGGLSPDVDTLDDMRAIYRLNDVQKTGAMCDILWSDPEEDMLRDWVANPRGCGWLFGSRPTKQFNLSNNISFIARAHQLVMDGYAYMFDNELITIWSAPNYCYKCANSAAVLHIGTDGSEEVQIYDACPKNERTVPDWKKIESQYFL